MTDKLLTDDEIVEIERFWNEAEGPETSIAGKVRSLLSHVRALGEKYKAEIDDNLQLREIIAKTNVRADDNYNALHRTKIELTALKASLDTVTRERDEADAVNGAS